MVVEFGKSDLGQRFISLFKRFEDVLNEEVLADNIDFWKENAESVGCDSILCQIHLARNLYRQIDNIRKPLPDRMMTKAEREIRLEGGGISSAGNRRSTWLSKTGTCPEWAV